MKVNFSSQIGAVNCNSKNEKILKNEQNKSNSSGVTDLKNMPNYRYMVRFGAKNENLETLFNAYGNNQGMPITYDEATQKLAKEDREKITDVYANYKSVYAEMENCHTVEELKEKYPQEFKNLTSSLTRKESKGSFLTQLNEWADLTKTFGEYLFPETKDNDFSVYLAKKIYLEAKTKKEIAEDFVKDINPNFNQAEINSLGASRRKIEDSNVIPDSVYSQLGLIGDLKSNGFRHSLSCSREAYIERYGSIYKAKRVETLNKVVDEVIGATKTEKTYSPQKNTAKYEKLQYAMYYVWNNSMDLRHALSEFLIQNNEDNELLKPDFMGINSATKTNLKQQNQKSLMSRFWAENPELRMDFKNKCNEAFDVVENAIDKGTFEDLKKEISTKREQIYEELRLEKEAKEAEQLAQKILKDIELEEQKRLQEIETKKQRIRDVYKKQIVEHLKEVSSYTPIPKSEYTKTSLLLQSFMDNAAEMPHEQVAKIAQNSFTALAKKVGGAIIKTFNDTVTNDLDKILKTAIKEIIKENPHYLKFNDTKSVKFLLNAELDSTTLVFQNKILLPYLSYICNQNSPEIPNQEKRKALDNMYKTCMESDYYKTNITNPIRKKTLDELVKLYKLSVPTTALYNTYRKNFINTPFEMNVTE